MDIDNKEQDKINKLGKQLSMDELEHVVGGVNSPLTELDEEGIDIGGAYCLEWDGSTWQQAVVTKLILLPIY